MKIWRSNSFELMFYITNITKKLEKDHKSDGKIVPEIKTLQTLLLYENDNSSNRGM